MVKCIISAFLFILLPFYVLAQVQSQTVEYKEGQTVLEGYLAYDDSLSGKRPGILVFHEWTGIGDYVKGRVRQLAREGYIAFAADIYGKGVRPQSREQASKQAGIYRKDRSLMRSRAMAGLETLKNQELTDTDRLGAIGYCFGGGVALELARSGAKILATVSFHGNLDTPNPSDAENIKGTILVLHGAEDSHVSKKQVDDFAREMNSAGSDWYMVSYGNAVHSFTNPSSGDDASSGVAYNENADLRSWNAMKALFEEIF